MKYALIGGGVLILVVAVVLISTHKPKQADTPPPPIPTPKGGNNGNVIGQALTVADDILNLLHKPSASVNTQTATNIPATPAPVGNAGLFGMGYGG